MKLDGINEEKKIIETIPKTIIKTPFKPKPSNDKTKLKK